MLKTPKPRICGRRSLACWLPPLIRACPAASKAKGGEFSSSICTWCGVEGDDQKARTPKPTPHLAAAAVCVPTACAVRRVAVVAVLKDLAEQALSFVRHGRVDLAVLHVLGAQRIVAGKAVPDARSLLSPLGFRALWHRQGRVRRRRRHTNRLRR